MIDKLYEFDLNQAKLSLFQKGNESPSEQEILIEIIRIFRDALLQKTDWEVTRGIEEGIDITELKTYRSALRNLPQEIEAGNIEAPTLNENGELVFNSWPVRGTE